MNCIFLVLQFYEIRRMRSGTAEGKTFTGPELCDLPPHVLFLYQHAIGFDFHSFAKFGASRRLTGQRTSLQINRFT